MRRRNVEGYVDSVVHAASVSEPSTPGSAMVRQVESATGQGNMNELALHFGLGAHDQPGDLEISWPYTKEKQKVTTKVNTVISITAALDE
jgi:hypothetical protein